jgi:hypothetical protein
MDGLVCILFEPNFVKTSRYSQTLGSKGSMKPHKAGVRPEPGSRAELGWDLGTYRPPRLFWLHRASAWTTAGGLGVLSCYSVNPVMRV